jgi:hypothetical protein
MEAVGSSKHERFRSDRKRSSPRVPGGSPATVDLAGGVSEVDADDAPGVSGGDGVADEKPKVTKGSKSWSVMT